MATSTPLPSRSPEETDNPGQDEFDKLMERQFSPGDELMMEKRAEAGAAEDAEKAEDESEDPSLDEIASAEAAGGVEYEKYENQVGRGYKKHPPQIGFIRRQLGKRNRIFLIGGTATALIVIAIVIFLSIVPFKIMHIVNNLQSHFFASSENAVQTETNMLFSNYMRKYVMPAMKNCPTSVDRSCNPITQGSLVSQLFKGWRNAKFEEKIADKYGIEFQYNKISKHYYLKAPGLTGSGLDLGTDNSGFAKSTLSLDEYVARYKATDPQFQRVSRSQLRAAVNDALDRETSWKKVMYRYKVGRLLEKKYGFKRCIFACDTRDNFNDWKDNKLRAAKLILAERVLKPHSETLYLVLGCILTDSPTCNPSTRTVSGDGPNGEPDTPIERDLSAALDKLALEETGKYADVLAHSSGILKDGYVKYIAKQIAGKLASAAGGDAAKVEAAQTVTADVVPVLGWINASAHIVQLAESAETLKAYAYVTNATAMVAVYSTYRTYADEIKTGHVDGELVGSMTDALGAGDKDSVGGIASAEQSPLYGYLIGGDISNSGNAISSLFGSSAMAAGSSPAYLCNNGKPVPAGKLICPEEVLGGADIPVVQYAQDFLDTLGPIKTLADYWNNSVGRALKKLIGLSSYITDPFLKFTHLADLINAAFSPILKMITDYLLPNPFSDSMSGGRTFDLMAGGADQANSDFSQNVLGGRKLTTQQASAILTQQNQQDLDTYKNKSLIAKITDTDSQYSVANKLAMSLPDSAKSLSGSISSMFLGNPFSRLASLLTAPFSFAHAGAAGTFPDPFGVSQYGYPANDANLTAANIDPETYWTNNCSSDGTTLDWNKGDNAKWVSSATVDPDTGLPEDDSTNPCMLILAAVGSAGGIYDSSLLTTDDLGDNPSSPASDNTSTTIAGTSFDSGQLYNDSTSVDCAAGTNDLGIQDGYHDGQLVKIRICAVPNLPSTSEESNGGFGVTGANGKAVVNSRVSGAVLAMVKAAANDGVTLTANSAFRTMAHQQALCAANALCASGNYTYVAKPGTSNHQMGLAIDFSTLPATPGPVPGNPVWDWLSKNAALFGYKNYPAEAWHWSPSGN